MSLKTSIFINRMYINSQGLKIVNCVDYFTSQLLNLRDTGLNQSNLDNSLHLTTGRQWGT